MSDDVYTTDGDGTQKVNDEGFVIPQPKQREIEEEAESWMPIN